MPIALLRIDDRLVHGQVVEGWLPSLKADLVVVVSDAVAADEVQLALMKMALPASVGLLAVKPADAPAALAELGARRALVLTPGPAEALALIDGGVSVDRVNVGGLHYTVGKVQLGRALFLDREDKKALAAIAARGVRLEGRPLPTDPEEDLAAMLEGR
jgi:PTS system mannose-specific IIB component